MCRRLMFTALVSALCLISTARAQDVVWDFENGNDHGFILWSVMPATPAPDDPNTAGDEALTGVGGDNGLPGAGVAWAVGSPNQFDGLKPAVIEGKHIDPNGRLSYRLNGQPISSGADFDCVNPRGQSGYLNTYNLDEYGDRLHNTSNDQIATSPLVLLGEGAVLTVWSQGGGNGTHAPELDPNAAEGYTDGSAGIAVLSATDGSLLASVYTQNKGTLKENALDLSAFAGQQVYIEVVDAFEGSWGWLAVDEIRITNAQVVPTAAMIVTNTSLVAGFDQAQKDRLEALGYEVTLATGADVKNGLFAKADAEMFDVLVVSESIGSGDINKLIGANVPMMHQESFGWSRHFFTKGLKRAWTTPANGELDVVNDTHPIIAAAGLSIGPVPFFTDPNVGLTTDLVASLVPGAVNLVQTTNTDGNDVTCIFAIEAGTALADPADPNRVAANRIVGFSLPATPTDVSYAANVMSDEAWALFDAAIAWLDPAPVEVPPMVAHWPMDEGAGTLVADVVGGNDGTMVGLDPNTAWIADGALGGAVRFSNVNGTRIEVPHADVLDFGDVDFSISLWVRYPVPPVDTDRWIIKGTHFSPGTGSRYELFQTSGPEVRWSIDNGPINKKTDLKVNNAPFITGEWVHVVVTRDAVNDLLAIYADGVLLGTAVDGSGDISNGEPLWIGESTDELNSAMSGDIDDIRIFDKALTEDEIAAIY